MSDMSRKEAIEVLKDIVSKPMLYSNFIMGACRVALASLETDEAYQLEYERTTKNDLGVDCISRKAVLDGFEKYSKGSFAYGCVWDYVKNLPSVTPQEPRKGKWIDTNNKGFEYHRIYKCSNCEYIVCAYPEDINVSTYCPCCGALMDGKEQVNE